MTSLEEKLSETEGSRDFGDGDPSDEESETESELEKTLDISSQSMDSHGPREDVVWAQLVPSSGYRHNLKLKKELTIIGRDPKCDVVIDNPHVSNNHCKIKRDPETHVVTLLDTSSNGTWVNKKKISKLWCSIKTGDDILFVPGSRKRKREKVSFTFKLEKIKKKDLQVEVDYDITRSLGSGAFAEVKLGIHRRTNKKYAIKVIDKSSWEKMKHATSRQVSLLDEVEIMKQANHKNIVKVHEYFQEDDGKVFVVMDFCNGGDMLEYIQKNGVYPEQKCRDVFRQLVEATEYLHSLKIAHRDLKPDNILLKDPDSNHVQISDFGISRTSSESMFCQTVIGTPLYQAPEVGDQRYKSNSVGYEGRLTDYWSLGVILYIMLVAAPPASEASEIVNLVRYRRLNFYGEDVCEAAADLLYRLLEIQPKDRITAQEIYKHPWMCGFRTMNDPAYKEYVKKLNVNVNVSVSVEEKKQESNAPTETVSSNVSMNSIHSTDSDGDLRMQSGGVIVNNNSNGDNGTSGNSNEFKRFFWECKSSRSSSPRVTKNAISTSTSTSPSPCPSVNKLCLRFSQTELSSPNNNKESVDELFSDRDIIEAEVRYDESTKVKSRSSNSNSNSSSSSKVRYSMTQPVTRRRKEEREKENDDFFSFDFASSDDGERVILDISPSPNDGSSHPSLSGVGVGAGSSSHSFVVSPSNDGSVQIKLPKNYSVKVSQKGSRRGKQYMSMSQNQVSNASIEFNFSRNKNKSTKSVFSKVRGTRNPRKRSRRDFDGNPPSKRLRNNAGQAVKLSNNSNSNE